MSPSRLVSANERRTSIGSCAPDLVMELDLRVTMSAEANSLFDSVCW
jgi:hypothetical protein